MIYGQIDRKKIETKIWLIYWCVSQDIDTYSKNNFSNPSYSKMPVTTRLMSLNRTFENNIKKFADETAFILNTAVENNVHTNFSKFPHSVFIPISIKKVNIHIMFEMFIKYFSQYSKTNAYNSNFYAIPTYSAGKDGITIISVSRFPIN